MARRSGPGPEDAPVMSEQQGVRYLHFGSDWVQGAMRVRRPDELVLAYTQQMMAWLLFLEPDASDELAMLGLGAGSLARFTHRYTTSRLHVVEWNPQVTAICRAYFRLPESGRMKIWHEDAADWVERPDVIGRFRALMVDLYDAQAQGPVCDSQAFYDACFGALEDVGMLVVNLFGRHSSFKRNIDHLHKAFNGRLLLLPEIDEGNRVAMAFKGPLLDVSVAQFLARAAQVRHQYGLPAEQWARSLLADANRHGRVVV
ncbi:MAG: spermidine synthase [Pusillimonas sp.]|jgi:spermidine synthase|nr:spermidine synthase [Pusillimonas sp.]|tara:strand:+ start:59411 stop:60184 length:774 start_codon:yes stop_codon:yes gene_type:complete